MKKICISLIIWVLLLVPNSAAAATDDRVRAFNQLYDCIHKLRQANPTFAMSTINDVGLLRNDLLYISDRHTPALYLYTPYFAGNADLSHIIEIEIKRTLDAQKLSSNPFPFTPCCQSGFSYHIRIPYFPNDNTQANGYFYLPITDSTARMYDEVYWGADHKMHAIRHDKPYMEVGPADARINNIIHFRAGSPQKIPDFTGDKPEPANDRTITTSPDNHPNKGVEYNPLDVEEKLWDKNAQNNFSAEAKGILLTNIEDGLRTLPLPHKVGQRADCWGHAGCDYTFSEEEVAKEQSERAEVMNSCKYAESEFHLDIFTK